MELGGRRDALGNASGRAHRNLVAVTIDASDRQARLGALANGVHLGHRDSGGARLLGGWHPAAVGVLRHQDPVARLQVSGTDLSDCGTTTQRLGGSVIPGSHAIQAIGQFWVVQVVAQNPGLIAKVLGPVGQPLLGWGNRVTIGHVPDDGAQQTVVAVVIRDHADGVFDLLRLLPGALRRIGVHPLDGLGGTLLTQPTFPVLVLDAFNGPHNQGLVAILWTVATRPDGSSLGAQRLPIL